MNEEGATHEETTYRSDCAHHRSGADHERRGVSGDMVTRPITLAQANAFVIDHHRHHDAARGHKFSLGAYKGERLVGVAIVGRPSGRYLDDGKTLEVTRLATDGTRNACSCLYGAAAKEAKRRGYKKIITYILQSEPGTTLRATGWTMEAQKCGKPEWTGTRAKERQRYEQLTLFQKKKPPREYKQRWGKELR